jgi:hypothetical protein
MASACPPPEMDYSDEPAPVTVDSFVDGSPNVGPTAPLICPSQYQPPNEVKKALHLGNSPGRDWTSY